MSDPCALCGGLGLLKTFEGSTACSCQLAARARARVKRANIPPGFAQASLSNFLPRKETYAALSLSMRYVEEFIPGGRAAGLLLTGPVGVGKTHLGTAILHQLVEEKGIEGRFVDVRDLLDRLRASYDDDAEESARQILRPILEADLVLIDELGAARPSDWVFETLELLIGGLYNRVVPVIVTSNLPNRPAGSRSENEYVRAARSETLGDRIGMRMWSRLQAMCKVVEINAPDWRQRT